MSRMKREFKSHKTDKTTFCRGQVPRILGYRGLKEKKRFETMARKREREEEPKPADGTPILGDLLVEKVLEKLDLGELAGQMAPSLAGRLLWSLNMDTLSERVLDKLAANLASHTALVDEVTTQMLKRLKVSQEILDG